MTSLSLWIYSTPLVIIWALYIAHKFKRQRRSKALHAQALEAGLTEPASLHPVINQQLCVGCTACFYACPEKDILGIVDGKAVLVNPTECIGHGACKAACPMDAIDLVFGSETRGVDIPFVGANFETNVPGVFIAGELGGMGLIRNAIEQGRQAMEAITKLDGLGRDERLDVVVIGAGPAGFAATLSAKENKLKFVTLEQESLGGTVSHYPRGKLVMTAPVDLPILGRVKMVETNKEALLEFWQDAERRAGLKNNYGERVETIEPIDDGFRVKTQKQEYATRAVLLALGRRGTPRKLGVPGEDLSKVVYRLIDPEQYRGQSILVVGGGDSALEAATTLAENTDSTVALSYRGKSFNRARPKNRNKVAEAERSGTLQVLLESNVQAIEQDRVTIEQGGRQIELPNDAVIINAGGILPSDFLKSIGIDIETKYGTA